MQSEIRFVTFTGRPLSGKSTIVKLLLEARPDLRLFEGLSFTTRDPRPDDVPGEYKYISPHEFRRMRESEVFLWSVAHNNYSLGTRKEDVLYAASAEYVSIMTLVPEVMGKLIECVRPEKVLSFFVKTPSKNEVMSRLKSRASWYNTYLHWARTEDWEQALVCNDAPYILVENPNEDPPAKSALDKVLSELSSRNI